MGVLLYKGIESDRKSKKYDYSRDVINAGKLCPEVRYACLSETEDEVWGETLFNTQLAQSVSLTLYSRLAGYW